MKHFVRKLKSSRLIKTLLWVLVVLGSAALIYFLLTNLNIFFVEKVNFEPIGSEEFKYLDKEELEKQSLELYGEKIINVNVEKVEKDIKDKNIFIEKIYVSKRFPKTINIRINEYEPNLVIEYQKPLIRSSSPKFLISDDGLILAECVEFEESCRKLPRLYYLNGNDIPEVGDEIHGTFFDNTSKLIDILEDNGIETKDISIPNQDVILVTLKQDKCIIFSSNKDLNTQVEKLILTQENLAIEGKSYKEIDLRFERPVIRVDKCTDWMTE